MAAYGLRWKTEDDADEKEKLYRFEKGLHPGGQAKEWWNGLGAADRKDWTLLMEAFERKWAKPKAARRAPDVVIQEPKTNILSSSDLEKYIDDEDGASVISHVAWTEVVRKLLAELPEGDKSMANISQSLYCGEPSEYDADCIVPGFAHDDEHAVPIPILQQQH
ncbi:hypothetical protein B0H11DRAFT_2259592 [Mycena galericulata]|nr:hypothetical protein B0H11DRAFT_2259592 [Mycena galericulata]